MTRRTLMRLAREYGLLASLPYAPWFFEPRRALMSQVFAHTPPLHRMGALTSRGDRILNRWELNHLKLRVKEMLARERNRE